MTPDELGSGYGSSVLSLVVEQSIAVNLTGGNHRGLANQRVLDEIAQGEIRPIQ